MQFQNYFIALSLVNFVFTEYLNQTAQQIQKEYGNSLVVDPYDKDYLQAMLEIRHVVYIVFARL